MTMFAQRLKQLRKERNETQKDVALLLDITLGGYSTYERGVNVPPYNKIQILADHFGVSIEFLMGQTNFRTNEDRIARNQDIRDVRSILMSLFDDLSSNMTVMTVGGFALTDEDRRSIQPSVETALRITDMIVERKRDGRN